MAKDFLGNILSIGLLGGAAYLAWEWWTAQTVQALAAPVISGSSTSSTPPPAYVYTPPTLQQQMQTDANSNAFAVNGQLDAYQWATLYNGTSPTPPPIPNVNAIFFPNGLPATQTPNAPGMSSQGLPLMSLATFLQGLQANGINTGLSGLGQAPAKMISVPIVIARQKTAMRIPANTTPAELQRRLRSRRTA